MRDLVSLFFLCAIFQTFQDFAICRRQHHHHKHLPSHLIRKRSTTLRLHKAPVNSLVEDVSESMTFHDHDKKLQAIAQAGEMYPEHKVKTAKRKDVIPKMNKLTKKIKDDNKDDDDDSDDSDDSDDDTGDKKFKIQKEESDGEDSDEKSSDNDEDDDDDDSGSGDDEDSNDDRKSKCQKRCKTPLTFSQCAFPRCSQKLGTIKDLCFYLCKHQKQRCEQVCD